MPFISAATAPTFERHGATFTGLASPSRGSRENAAWLLTLADSGPGVPHTLSREEIFVCIEGRAEAQVGLETHELTAGSALVVPPNVEFSIRNRHPAPFRAVAVLPVGGQASVGSAPAFTPPWAL